METGIFMKMNRSKYVTVPLALMTCVGLFAGCVTKSYDKGADTSSAVDAAAKQIGVLNTETIESLKALNNLTFKSQGDLRSQFDKFNSAVKELGTASNDLDVKIADMQAKAQVYIDSWSNQLGGINSENIRSLSAGRKADVTAKLDAAKVSYEGVKTSLKPFMSDMTDIQTYLNNDLTAGGLAAIKDTVAKTKADAVPVRESIRKLQSDFSALGTSLSPVMPGGK
jgi:hypothetical protein